VKAGGKQCLKKVALLSTCLLAGSFLGLFFDTEDRDVFLQNIG
jgi:hypothetical protein